MLPFVTNCLDDDRHYIQLAVGRVYPKEIGAHVEEYAGRLGSNAFSRATEKIEHAEKARLRRLRE